MNLGSAILWCGGHGLGRNMVKDLLEILGFQALKTSCPGKTNSPHGPAPLAWTPKFRARVLGCREMVLSPDELSCNRWPLNIA